MNTIPMTIAGLAAFILLISLASLTIEVSAQAPQFEAVKGEETCASDRLMCPDGTSVGRVPPSCEFATCATEAGDDSLFKG